MPPACPNPKTLGGDPEQLLAVSLLGEPKPGVGTPCSSLAGRESRAIVRTTAREAGPGSREPSSLVPEAHQPRAPRSPGSAD